MTSLAFPGSPQELAERLEKGGPKLLELAARSLLTCPLDEILEADQLALLPGLLLDSTKLFQQAQQWGQDFLADELEYWKDREVLLEDLLQEENQKSLRVLASDASWLHSSLLDEIPANAVLQGIASDTLYEVIRDFNNTVNPFFSSWGLPALLKKAGPLGRLMPFGSSSLQLGGKLFETLRDEFERQMEPHLKQFLQNCTRVALEGALTRARNREADFQALQGKIFDQTLQRKPEEFIERALEHPQRKDLEEKAATFWEIATAELLRELQPERLESIIQRFLEREGHLTVEENLERVGISPEDWVERVAKLALPTWEMLCQDEVLVEALFDVLAFPDSD